MKKVLGCMLGLMTLTGCAATGSQAPYQQVSMAEAEKMMKEDSDYVLVDVRTAQEYATGHIPGAILLPNETINESAAQNKLPDKDETIFVYCRSGNRSKQAAAKLAELGYKHVIEIGGIGAWNGDLTTGMQP